MIHDRYHASRRNPWNEIECGDHYARSMASYGVYLAACGFSYHGPRGQIGFAPRLTPEDFKCAFTSAEGWGTFSQKRDGQSSKHEIRLRWGRLKLTAISLVLPEETVTKRIAVGVKLNGRRLRVQHDQNGTQIVITLTAAIILTGKNRIEITVEQIV